MFDGCRYQLEYKVGEHRCILDMTKQRPRGSHLSDVLRKIGACTREELQDIAVEVQGLLASQEHAVPGCLAGDPLAWDCLPINASS